MADAAIVYRNPTGSSADYRQEKKYSFGLLLMIMLCSSTFASISAMMTFKMRCGVFFLPCEKQVWSWEGVVQHVQNTTEEIIWML